jgi:histidyl-tRNA synthetase
MQEIYALVQHLGLQKAFTLDPSITRGLDYYTGIVYETFLNALPDIGSVCSGGRYNNLASLYTKQELPGVGSSIGLDRLTAALDELGGSEGILPPVKVLVFMQDSELTTHYYEIAGRLRTAGISAEVYLEDRKLAAQFSYAEKKRIPIGVICGQEEFAQGTVNVRDLRTRESHNNLTVEAGIEQIRKLL